MKKFVISACVLAAVSLGAQAQSSLTVYGVADGGLLLERGGEGGSVQKISSGMASSSRLGFKAREDLGGGAVLTAILENGFSLDTGAANQNGALFGRQALLCLSGKAGALSVGKQYTPFYKTLDTVADPFVTGMAGNAQNVFDGTTRIGNTVEYITPRIGGFKADLQYGLGEAAGNSVKNRYLGASGSYEQGPLTLELAHQRQDDALATAHSRNTMLVVRYVFGDITGHAAHARNRDAVGRESRDTLAGLTAQLDGTNKLFASLIEHPDQSAAQQHARQAAVGLSHQLSRRTDLYTAYGHIRNSNGAAFRVGTAANSGSGTTGLNLGVRHPF